MTLPSLIRTAIRAFARGIGWTLAKMMLGR